MKKLLLLLTLLFSICVNAQPPSVMPDFTACDVNNDGFETFDLSSQIPAILGGLNPNTTTVTFYETSADAQIGANPIINISAYSNITPQVQPIYIRVVDSSDSQIYFSTMNLVVAFNNAGADGSTTACDNSTTTINLFSLITGEQAGGNWVRVAGTGGTFNAVAGTYLPAVGATTSTFIYTLSANQNCPSDSSVATVILSTCVVPVVCGGTFTDPAGATANYANNMDYTVTIYPDFPGELVTVTFTSFNTETNWDALYVFNGNSIAAPQIASANPAGNVPGGLAGGYWGTVIPGPFTSSSIDGSLTFRFRSDGTGVRSGWIANVTCAPPATCSAPTPLAASGITHNSVTLNWTQPPNADNSVATAWDIIALPCGSPAPTASSTPTLSNITGPAPYVLTGLTPGTCYSICIRAVCSASESSTWSCFNAITTTSLPPTCGGQFVDNGGVNGDYTNNANVVTTICPDNPGDLVTVTFSSFNTEVNFDALYVFDGNGISASQISSTNAAGNVPGGLPGGYWGTTIPGPFTSTNLNGCLTFLFRSDGSQVRAGWVANVTCAPPPTCSAPFGLSISGVTPTTATLNWIQPANPDGSVALSWEVFLQTAGGPIPTAVTSPSFNATGHPTNISALVSSTCYTVYVRAACSATDKSNWSAGFNFCTLSAPPVCGGQFVDNGGASANYTNSADVTTTICPTNPGEIVTVVFSTFDVEATWDALYVFDGNSIAAPQITSGNPAANVPGGVAGGYWGTVAPGPFISSSPDGCLTFRFRSDNTQTRAGWIANVSCAPDADKVVLVAFIDNDNNGIMDSGEPLF